MWYTTVSIKMLEWVARSTPNFVKEEKRAYPCVASDKRLGRSKVHMKQNNTVSRIRALVTPVAEEMGYFIWDVEYFKEGATRILRITIDSEDGITIDDCEKLSRVVSDMLDEEDPIEESYTFQVSSPGIERELKCQMHIEACEGWDVEVKFYAPEPQAGGAKVLRGVLGGYDDDGNIIIYSEDPEKNPDAQATALDPSKIASIKTTFDFGKL